MILTPDEIGEIKKNKIASVFNSFNTTKFAKRHY